MLPPLSVAATSPEWKARLLVVSSQASPPSSQASFQKAVIHLTASIVFFEFSTTFLPVLSVSAPPNVHVSGYDQPGASLTVWPSVWPKGLPFFLRVAPSFRYSSRVLGGAVAPASANQDLR